MHQTLVTPGILPFQRKTTRQSSCRNRLALSLCEIDAWGNWQLLKSPHHLCHWHSQRRQHHVQLKPTGSASPYQDATLTTFGLNQQIVLGRRQSNEGLFARGCPNTTVTHQSWRYWPTFKTWVQQPTSSKYHRAVLRSSFSRAVYLCQRWPGRDRSLVCFLLYQTIHVTPIAPWFSFSWFWM